MRGNIRDIFKIPSGIPDEEISKYLNSRVRTPSASDIAKMNKRLRIEFVRIKKRERPNWYKLRFFVLHPIPRP
jgi:hypothetical protein